MDEIKMRDWVMAGHVIIIRELLEPVTFLYYLPSLKEVASPTTSAQAV